MTEAFLPPVSHSRRLVELAILFLRLGATAFGGPAAHIAMFEDEVVRRRQWLTHDDFLDLAGRDQPDSRSELHRDGHSYRPPTRRLAGSARGRQLLHPPGRAHRHSHRWAYVRFGRLPNAKGLLYGVKPVIIAIVLQALWGLGKTALKTKALAIAGGWPQPRSVSWHQ